MDQITNHKKKQLQLKYYRITTKPYATVEKM